MNKPFLKTISVFVVFFFSLNLLLPPKGLAFVNTYTPLPATCAYSYDTMNRLTNITDSSAQNIATYSYDKLSRRVGGVFLNGTSAGYSYDAIDIKNKGLGPAGTGLKDKK